MAVSCHVAFGHYLRTLRERRGLALDDVWTLSQTFPESLNKGYLSRCENGKQKLALPKVVAMSRIYEVPADVLIERLELDLELEKIGGPPTEKLGWEQLRQAGKNAFRHGHKWAGYAFMRDATFNAAIADLDSTAFTCIEEQIVSSFTNCATAARSLGKYRYALHEYRFVDSCPFLGPDSTVLIAERLALTHFCLGDNVSAQHYADLALQRLEQHSDTPFRPFVYSQQGFFLVQKRKYAEAVPWFQKAYEVFKRQGNTGESTNALIGLADCYQESGNLGAASKTLDVAAKLSAEHSLVRLQALTLTLQGLVDEDSSRPEAAEDKLRKALKLAKDLKDRILRFQVEFYLYKHALKHKKHAAARSIRRRLNTLAPSVPGTIEQVLYFRIMDRDREVASN